MVEKKKKENAVPMLIGISVALVGAFLVNQQTAARVRRVEGRYDKAYLAVLTKNIGPGEEIKPEDVEIVEVVRGPKIHTAIEFRDPRSGTDAKRRNKDIKNLYCSGKANGDLEKGNLLLLTDLFYSSSRKLLEDRFESEKRAVTIKVDADGMMGGLLQPGDRVDILATYRAGPIIGGQQNGREENTKVILEDEELLAVGGQLESGVSGRNTRGGTIVLGLSPDKAMELSIYKNQATFSVLLRSSKEGSKGSYTTKELSNRELNGFRNRL